MTDPDILENARRIAKTLHAVRSYRELLDTDRPYPGGQTVEEDFDDAIAGLERQISVVCAQLEERQDGDDARYELRDGSGVRVSGPHLAWHTAEFERQKRQQDGAGSVRLEDVDG